MIDRVGFAHPRTDRIMNYGAAIVLAGLAGLMVWTTSDLYTVNRYTKIVIPGDVAVTPSAALFPQTRSVAEADQSECLAEVLCEVAVTPLAALFPPTRSFAEADQSECLAEVLYYEARGEGTEGEKAVAEVVLQRTRDTNYPHTICGVVYEGVQPNNKNCQFSFACNGSLRQPKERGAWRHVRRLAERILSGAVKLAGETGHAIAYHSVDVNPVWADDMIETTQIGNHIFYRRDPTRVAANAAEPDLRPAAEDAPQTVGDITGDSKEVHSEVQTPDAVGQGA